MKLRIYPPLSLKHVRLTAAGAEGARFYSTASVSERVCAATRACIAQM
jgi:hypothetical protein